MFKLNMSFIPGCILSLNNALEGCGDLAKFHFDNAFAEDVSVSFHPIGTDTSYDSESDDSNESESNTLRTFSATTPGIVKGRVGAIDALCSLYEKGQQLSGDQFEILQGHNENLFVMRTMKRIKHLRRNDELVVITIFLDVDIDRDFIKGMTMLRKIVPDTMFI